MALLALSEAKKALPQGSLFNVHPHTHALVPAGIMKGGVFYEQRNISTSVIAEIFRARLLTVLLEHGVITQVTIRPPPLRAKIPTANIPDTAFWDSIPPVESYSHDTEYAN